MRTTAIAAVAVLALTAGASLASADTLRAHYSTSLGRSINITRAGDTRDIPTVSFNWTRTDAPGAGVDSTIPVNFDTYCIEITQTIGGGDHDFEILSPAAAGLSSFQELMLERLWGSFKAGVNTDEKSAAFQASVWKIIYDSASTDIGADVFHVNAPSISVRDLAQDWLNIITDAGYSGPSTDIFVLHNGEVQDQITNVPAPATAALGLLGLTAAGRRRRTTAAK